MEGGGESWIEGGGGVRGKGMTDYWEKCRIGRIDLRAGKCLCMEA